MHAYPDNRPDVTQFVTMIDLLTTQHAALAARATGVGVGVGVGAAAERPSRSGLTVVFDAGLGFIGSIPPSDYPDLLALPAVDRTVVDADRFGGLTALDTRRVVFGDRTPRHAHPHSPPTRGCAVSCTTSSPPMATQRAAARK